MTDAEAAAMALQFMERAQLVGSEAPAFMRTQAWLQGIATPASAPGSRPDTGGQQEERDKDGMT